VRPPRATAPERAFWDADDLQCIADAIDPRYRSFVLFAGYSGCRFAELTALQVKDINPLKGWVTVSRTTTEVAGKLHQGGPKSQAGHRTIPMPAVILETIAPDLAGKSADDLVFTSPHGGPLRRTLYAKRFWKPALERAGLPPAGLHSLRHSAVSAWLTAGASMREAQVRAGHSNPALNLSIYSHVTPEAFQVTTDRLDEMARRAGAGL